MSETASIVFKPDGLCVGLYTELINLAALGRLNIRRASRIEFDDDKQAWRVRDMRGIALFTSPSRHKCLEWEQQYFGKKAEV